MGATHGRGTVIGSFRKLIIYLKGKKKNKNESKYIYLLG
jgi:hypothetical protein